MNLPRYATVLLLPWLASGLALAAPVTGPAFHAQVAALYSFEPHKLGKADIEAKSSELDNFWAAAKADPAGALPLLRQELETPGQSAFFYYDGSKLLMSLSNEAADQALALRSIAKADLRGVQLTDYLITVQRLASKGFDTREAAFKILDVPGFLAFIPQHALTLGQNYSLIYMLFPMDEALFAPDLAMRLEVNTNVQAQKSVLLALWYVATPEATAAIRRFSGRDDAPADAKDYAKSLLAKEGSALLGFSFSSAQSLREERRKLMQRPISDESLIEFERLTLKLRARQ